MAASAPDAGTLVLLHGLGATASVFRDMICLAEAEGRRCVAPDLPGHGRAPWTADYAVNSQARAVAQVLPADGPLIVVGHSLGGVVALALASGRYGRAPTLVVGLGIKVDWTAAEIASATARAGASPRLHATREEAARAFLRASGLEGLVASDDPIVADGLAETPEGWRLAADPATPSAGAPDMTALMAQARCPVRLACGERDPLVTLDALRRFDPRALSLGPFGHSAHVEAPDAVWSVLRALMQGEAAR